MIDIDLEFCSSDNINPTFPSSPIVVLTVCVVSTSPEPVVSMQSIIFTFPSDVSRRPKAPLHKIESVIHNINVLHNASQTAPSIHHSNELHYKYVNYR